MARPMVTRTALVTGGNRGIGFEVCRQPAGRGLQVLVGAREPSLGSEAVEVAEGTFVEALSMHSVVASRCPIAKGPFGLLVSLDGIRHST